MEENQFDEATRTALEITLVQIKMDGLDTALETIKDTLKDA